MMNPMDPIAVGGLTVGAVSAVAAIAAAYYAKKSPTKEDLARVEDHLAEQNRRESLARRADRLSISVHGDAYLTESLELVFVLEDPGAVLLRAGLINNASTLTASVECAPQAPHIFSATVDTGFVFLWYQSGEVTGTGRRALKIRASFTIDGAEADRAFPVELRRSTRYLPEPTPPAEGWFLNGQC
jgi:hypothetical protein